MIAILLGGAFYLWQTAPSSQSMAIKPMMRRRTDGGTPTPGCACPGAASLLTRDGEEIDKRRELTPNVVEALKEGGFFRMLQPRSIGGLEMKPSDFCRVTEALASADGSTAWVVCQSNGCAMSAAYLDPRWRSRCSDRWMAFWPGDRRALRSRRTGAWRLPHLRHLALRQRVPERHLARRAHEGRGDEGKSAPCCSPNPAPG